MVGFIDKLRGADFRDDDVIPPWYHDLTPESQKRKVSDKTYRQKETVERLRMEMRGIVKQHRLDS